MRLVVIGGVAAGLSAAARARRIDRNLEIIVLEKGNTISYGACGLPYYLDGRVQSLGHLMVYTPEYFRNERNIMVRTGAEVASISHSRREVALTGGEKVHYDRLVIATGARPNREAIAGSDLPHVFALHTLEDARRLKEFIDRGGPKRAVVVGAGYIGLEVADALRGNGLAVTILEASCHILHREDAELTKFMKDHLARHRIELRCQTRVDRIEPGQTAGVACDLVVIAAGLRPNVALAVEAGIEVGRTGAIRTSDQMETNLLGVYAAGDCAETLDLVTGKPVYIPLGTTANKMGRVAGANAAGTRERFKGVVGTSIVRVCGVGFAMTGLSALQARKEGFDPVPARIHAWDRASYFGGRATTVELVADRRSRRLLGGTVIGHNGVEGRINVIATALSNRNRIEDFEQLDLAYAPPFAPVWDPVLIAAQQLSKLID